MKYLWILCAAVYVPSCLTVCDDEEDDCTCDSGGVADTDTVTDTETDTDTDTGSDVETCKMGTFRGNYTIGSPFALEELAGYTAVTGDLLITLSTELTDLAELECLEVVGGAVRIDYNNRLVSLDGLQHLTTIGTYLDVNWNPLLETADLRALTSVGWSFSISNNAMLENLNLGSLEYVGESFYISGNESLVCDEDALLDGVDIVGEVMVGLNAENDGCGPS